MAQYYAYRDEGAVTMGVRDRRMQEAQRNSWRYRYLGDPQYKKEGCFEGRAHIGAHAYAYANECQRVPPLEWDWQKKQCKFNPRRFYKTSGSTRNAADGLIPQLNKCMEWEMHYGGVSESTEKLRQWAANLKNSPDTTTPSKAVDTTTTTAEQDAADKMTSLSMQLTVIDETFPEELVRGSVGSFFQYSGYNVESTLHFGLFVNHLLKIQNVHPREFENNFKYILSLANAPTDQSMRSLTLQPASTPVMSPTSSNLIALLAVESAKIGSSQIDANMKQFVQEYANSIQMDGAKGFTIQSPKSGADPYVKGAGKLLSNVISGIEAVTSTIVEIPLPDPQVMEYVILVVPWLVNTVLKYTTGTDVTAPIVNPIMDNLPKEGGSLLPAPVIKAVTEFGIYSATSEAMLRAWEYIHPSGIRSAKINREAVNRLMQRVKEIQNQARQDVMSILPPLPTPPTKKEEQLPTPSPAPLPPFNSSVPGISTPVNNTEIPVTDQEEEDINDDDEECEGQEQQIRGTAAGTAAASTWWSYFFGSSSSGDGSNTNTVPTPVPGNTTANMGGITPITTESGTDVDTNYRPNTGIISTTNVNTTPIPTSIPTGNTTIPGDPDKKKKRKFPSWWFPHVPLFPDPVPHVEKKARHCPKGGFPRGTAHSAACPPPPVSLIPGETQRELDPFKNNIVYYTSS